MPLTIGANRATDRYGGGSFHPRVYEASQNLVIRRPPLFSSQFVLNGKYKDIIVSRMKLLDKIKTIQFGYVAQINHIGLTFFQHRYFSKFEDLFLSQAVCWEVKALGLKLQ